MRFAVYIATFATTLQLANIVDAVIIDNDALADINIDNNLASESHLDKKKKLEVVNVKDAVISGLQDDAN